MDNLKLNARLKAFAEEKQGLLEQIGSLQQETERQALWHPGEGNWKWLSQQPMVLTEYDEGVTRRLVEQGLVVDAETTRVKLWDTDVEVEQKL